MADRRIGKRVKTVTVFFSALNSGCDFFVNESKEASLSECTNPVAMTNREASDLYAVDMRNMVKDGRLWLAKKRKKGSAGNGQKAGKETGAGSFSSRS